SGNRWTAMKDVSADAGIVVYSILHPKNGRDLWVLDTKTKTARALCNGPANEFDARLSPDGHLIAIASEESGRPELYVQDFPEGKRGTRGSVSGLARDPNYSPIRWSKDGSSLWFLDADGRTVRASQISDQPALTASKPEATMHLPAGL